MNRHELLNRPPIMKPVQRTPGYQPLREREMAADDRPLDALCAPLSGKSEPYSARIGMNGGEMTEGQVDRNRTLGHGA